jgi:hypothetical protein
MRRDDSMSEAEWLHAVGPERLMAYLSVVHKTDATPAGDRKFRLFAVACCRMLPPSEIPETVRDAMAALESAVDSPSSRRQLARIRRSITQSGRIDVWNLDSTSQAVAHAATDDAYEAVSVAALAAGLGGNRDSRPQRAIEQIRLVHDLFGNPFRPVAFAPSWRTTDAIGLARAMYDSRDFAAMPILADALEDAGCDSADVLAHCRGDGPHVRGCWVVDHVLGKS